jgi:6-pyruvoyltetrahydropterin/6-carboxytetrahydropterin synthase
MYVLTIKSDFAAAHQIRGYQGACENLHGHNWKVELTITASKLNELGIVIDFREMQRILDEVLDQLDHKNLNELTPFRKTNPTSENICYWLFQELEKRLSSPGIKLDKVTVRETDKYAATYCREICKPP